jgi:hypothetical protein
MTFKQQQDRRRRRKPLFFAAAAATATAAFAVAAPATAFLHHDGAVASQQPHHHYRERERLHQRSIVPSPLPRSTSLLFSVSTSGNDSMSRSRPQRLSTDGSNRKNGDDDDISQQQPPAGSPLRRICDEESEFKMAVGKAIDTLRKDYPDILERNPDFSIYDKDIEVVDPSGVTLHGVRNYKTSFSFMHGLVKFFYCPKDSGLTFRLMYDTLRNSIRVSWNAVLVPRAIYGGEKHLLHVDGISVYDFDRATGQIVKHHIEHLLLNGEPQRPQEGVFSAIRNQAVSDGVPVFTVLDPNGGLSAGTGTGVDGRSSSAHNPFAVEFNTGMGTFLQNLLSPPFSPTRTSLFSMSEASDCDGNAANGIDADDFDEAAFNKKNVSRKKFGLPPMSVAEFQELQVQVQQMEAEQKAKAAQMAAAAAQMAESKKEKKNVLSSLFGGILQDTCESNYDCERPEVCCDLGFKKMCCSSGMMVFNGGLAPAQQRQLIRVPAPSGEEGQMPRGGPGGMNDGPYSGY